MCLSDYIPTCRGRWDYFFMLKMKKTWFFGGHTGMPAVLVMSSDSYAGFLGHLVWTVGDISDQKRHLPSPQGRGIASSEPCFSPWSPCVKCQQPYNFRFLHCFALGKVSLGFKIRVLYTLGCGGVMVRTRVSIPLRPVKGIKISY